MTITKEEIKEAIISGSSFLEGEVNLVDIREVVEEIRNECIDEFDESIEDGTTISTTLLNKYAHLMNYEALMLTFPKLPTPR